MMKYGKKMVTVGMVAMAAGVMLFSIKAEAAALAAARDTPERSGELVALVVKASNTIYAGALVAVDTAAGTVVPAADAAARVVLGRADHTALAGETLAIRRGVFRWVNSGEFTDAHIGQFAYVADDQSVTTAALATNDVIAGVIVDVDADGVWVDSYAVPAQAAATLAALTVTGNGAVGGTLAVTGVATFTAESVHNLGIDTDYVTTDAGAGVDTKTAGALAIGAATATSVDVSKAGAMTTVKGTFNVDQAATFDTTVVATGDVKGATLSIGSGSLARVAGTLVWIEGGVTNALDADVTQ